MNKEKLTDWVELIVAELGKIPMLPFFLLFSLIGLGIGAFMIINPNLAIEIQRRFYEKINWKIEPISVSREIRNTRLMGYLLVVFLIVLLFLVLTKGLLLP